MNKQYNFDKNVLVLSVNKTSFFIRIVLYFITIIFFLMPLFGMILGLSNGKGLHVANVFFIIFFGILGFYMLRISLWNTFGKEIITFENNKITYYADYFWFKDSKRQKELILPFDFSTRQIGYEDDNTGVLILGKNEPIICVTKMPNSELIELICKLDELVKRS